MGTSYYYNKIPNNVNNYNKVIYSDFYNGFIDVLAHMMIEAISLSQKNTI
jgi:hypothetical protein